MKMEENQTKNRTSVDYFWISVRGFAMGASDIVPGVSGGTMAFILGIYDELIDAIHSIDMGFIRKMIAFKWREAFSNIPWQFLLALGLGLVTAVLTLSNGLHWALETHPILVWSFFFGLIVSSIIVIRNRVQHWSFINIFAALAAAVGAYILVGLTPSETPHTPPLLFLSGAIAICAMILPGISGAFILVLLGKYSFVLGAVKSFDFLTIMFVGLGAAVGLVSFARLLRWTLRKNHDLVVAILTGFMAGSLRKVWPWKSFESISETFVKETNLLPSAFTLEEGLALFLMIAGMTTILFVERFANN